MHYLASEHRKQVALLVVTVPLHVLDPLSRSEGNSWIRLENACSINGEVFIIGFTDERSWRSAGDRVRAAQQDAQSYAQGCLYGIGNWHTNSVVVKRLPPSRRDQHDNHPNPNQEWKRYQEHRFRVRSVGLVYHADGINLNFLMIKGYWIGTKHRTNTLRKSLLLQAGTDQGQVGHLVKDGQR